MTNDDIKPFVEKSDNTGVVYISISDVGYEEDTELVKNMFLTNGKSNMIFLNVFSMNGYPNLSPPFNFNSDGTTVKFVSVNGSWAVEGNSYSDSVFFTEKTM